MLKKDKEVFRKWFQLDAFQTSNYMKQDRIEVLINIILNIFINERSDWKEQLISINGMKENK